MKITKEGQIPGQPPDGLFAGTCDRCKTEVEGLLSEMRPNSLDADSAFVDTCPVCGYAWISCQRVTEIQGKVVAPRRTDHSRAIAVAACLLTWVMIVFVGWRLSQ